MAELLFQRGDTIPPHVECVVTAAGEVLRRTKIRPAMFALAECADSSPGWGTEDTSHPVGSWRDEDFPLTAVEV